MSTTHSPRAKEIKPTDQYKMAVYGLQCGDRSFAEDFLSRQLERARAVHEAFDIAAKLGWLSEKGMTSAGFTPTQLSLPVGENGHEQTADDVRLNYVKERLGRAGHNGLSIWTLVSEIGKHESAPYREEGWRKPVAAYLNEYAELGEIVRKDLKVPRGEVVSQFYLPKYAPSSAAS